MLSVGVGVGVSWGRVAVIGLSLRSVVAMGGRQVGGGGSYCTATRPRTAAGKIDPEYPQLLLPREERGEGKGGFGCLQGVHLREEL